MKMQNFVAGILAITLVWVELVKASIAPNQCPDASWGTASVGRCYILSASTATSLEAARENCNSVYGAELASIAGTTENNKVAGLVTGSHAWLGLIRISSSSWSWYYPNQAFSYTFWQPGTPATCLAGDCDGCAMLQKSNNRWVVVPCTGGATQFVCVKQAQCPRGYFYYSSYANGAAGSCRICPRGKYSDMVGSTECQNCPAGTYGSTTGLNSPSCTAVCPLGYYCPANSISATACPIGNYGGSTGLQSVADCKPCAAGYICSATASIDPTGRTASNPTTERPCPAARCSNSGASACSYCPPGASCPTTGTPCPGVECGFGNYCPQNTGQPNRIVDGRMGINPVIPNSNTTFTTWDYCPAGYSCTDGIPSICPAGTYTTRGTNPICRNCTGGYNCPEGSQTSAPRDCAWWLKRNLTVDPFPQRFYCPSGAPEPLEAPYGYYTTPETGDVWRRSGIIYCPPESNNFCINGTRSSIMVSRTSCTRADINEGWPCTAYNPATTPPPNCAENTSRGIWSYDFDFNSKLPEFISLNSSVEFLGITWLGVNANLSNCQPTTIAKNQDLFFFNPGNNYLSLRRQGFRIGLNYEVCVESRSRTSYRAKFVHRASVIDPINGVLRNITNECFPEVRVIDQNESPYFAATTKYLQIKEKSPIGTPLLVCDQEGINAGCPPCSPELSGSCDPEPQVFARDPDFGATFTHFIKENDNTTDREDWDLTLGTDNPDWKFEIEACSGKLSVLNDVPLKYSTARNVGGARVIYHKIAAKDQRDWETVNPIDVYIYIINVNDDPILSESNEFTFYIKENSPAGTVFDPAVPTYFDEDEDVLTFYDAPTFIPYETYTNGRSYFSFNADSLLRVTVAGAAVLDFENPSGAFAITVTGADGNGGFSTRTFPVIVTDANDPPIFLEAGPFTILENRVGPVCSSQVTSGICDTGVPVSTTDQDLGNWPSDRPEYGLLDTVDLTFSINPSTGQIIVAKQLNYETTPLLGLVGQFIRGYTIRVTATSFGHEIDNTTQTTVKAVQIIVVNENEPPAFNRSLVLYTALETHPISIPLTPVAPFIADPDDIGLKDGESANAMTFSMAPVQLPGSAAANFSVSNANLNTMKLSLLQRLDYESTPPCDFDPSRRCLTFTIRAFDQVSPIEGIITVEVIDINEAPYYPVGSSLGSVSIVENTVVSGAPVALSYPGTTFFAKDPDIYRTPFVYLTYDVVGGSGASFFEIVNMNSIGINSNQTHFYVRTKPNLGGINFNFESGLTSYTLVVRARDTGPTSFVGKKCDVDADCGENAYCSSQRCFESCYSASGSVPRKTGAEMSFFCDYTLATQNSFPFDSTSGSLTINVLDANDPPVLIGTSQSSPFCRWNTSIVKEDVTSKLLIPIESLLTVTRDEDPIDTSFTYTIDETFSATGYKGDLWSAGFGISNATTGRITLPLGTNLSAFALEDDLAGRVTITDPRGAFSTCVIVVVLSDFNAIPVIYPNSTTIPENSPAGSFLFYVNASDTPGDVLTFSIAANPNFVINSTTGLLTTSSQANLDYETQREYNVLVRVRDRKNSEATATYTIYVSDVDDPPVFVNLPALFTFPEVTGANYVVIASLTSKVSDPDANDTITFSLPSCTPSQSCPFQISPSTGQINIWSGFTGVTDFESETNSWRVTLRASDSHGLFVAAEITLALTDVNEPPVFSKPVFNISVVENVVFGSVLDLMAVSSDPDFGDARTFQMIQASQSGKFNVSSGGALAVLSALDYEDINLFTITVLVRDRLGLNSTSTITVFVQNVNDLTITSVSPSIVATCGGGELVTIDGSNFGLKNPLAGQTAVVVGKYRAAGRSVEYVSPSCTVTTANTRIRCSTAAGVGGDLIWNITVSVPGDVNLQSERVVASLSTAFSYPAPAITAVSNGLSALRTRGGDIFQINGTCLGTANDQIDLRTVGAGRDFVQLCNGRGACFNPMCSHAGTSLNCTSPAGIGATLSLQVKIGGRTSPILPNAGAYNRPSVTWVNTPIMSTLGIMPNVQCCLICNPGFVACGDECLTPGSSCAVSQGCACKTSQDTQLIIVRGTDFGPVGSAPDYAYARLAFLDSTTGAPMTIERNLMQCTVTKPFEEISCNGMVPGTGYHMPIRVSFGDQDNLVSIANISYEAPRALSMSGPFNRATTQGGQIIEIRGQNFGPSCGGTSSSSLLDPCPYASAYYTAKSRHPISGDIIEYHPACRVVSQSLIFCLTTPGTGADLEWHMSVGNQGVIGIETFRGAYAPPVVGGYSGAGADSALTSGGQEILLTGSQFGPLNGASIIARYGLNPEPEFLAANCTVVEANDRIRCVTGPGAGSDLKWYVVVDGQSSVNAQTSYGIPVITGVSGAGVNSSTDGNAVVILEGYNFGPGTAPGPYLDRVVYGPPSFPYAYEATCSILIPHTRIRCLTAPGVGFNLFWMVTVRQLTSGPSIISTNYVKPTLLTLSSNSSNTKGGAQLRLTGLNMALCDPQSKPYVRFGIIDVEISNRRMGVSPNIIPLTCPTPVDAAYARKEVTFVVPEMTLARRLTVSYVLVSSRLDYQTFQSENTLTFTYDDPVIFEVYAVPTIEVTRLRVTISGKNFCASEVCCQTLFDASPVAPEDVEFHTHDVITFVIRSTGTVQVKCGDYTTPPKTFTAEDPYVVATTPMLSEVAFPTLGGAQIIVWGLYFGLSFPEIYIGTRLCEVLLHESVTCDENLPSYADFSSAGTTIYCWKTTIIVPPGEGKAERLLVKNGNQTSHFHSVNFEQLRYEAPSLGGGVSVKTSFGGSGRRLETVCCFKTDGSDMATITFSGSNLGTQGFVWLGYVDNIKAIVEAWNHTTVTVRIPPGEGKDLQVLFYSGDQEPLNGPPNLYVSYANPVITHVDRGADPVPTTGGSVLTVIGSNFGRPYEADCEFQNCTSNAPSIQLIGSTITFCQVISGTQTDSSMQCTVPQGAGANLTVRVTVAAQSGQLTNAFNYDPPVIYSVTPELVPTSGRDPNTSQPLVMTITGENFGITDLCIKIIDPRPSEPNFAIAARPVTQPSLFGCAQLDQTQPPVVLSAPSHTSVQLYVPEFHGKNVKIVVVAGGQESPVPGNFSYISPIVDTIQILNKTWSSGAGRRIGNTAFLFNGTENGTWSALSFGDWTNIGPSRQFCHVSTLRGLRGYGWKVSLDVQEDGNFIRHTTFYNSTECADARQLFRVTTTGRFIDMSAHGQLFCSRTFFEYVASIDLEPLSDEGLNGLNTVLPGCACDSLSYIRNIQMPVTQCFTGKMNAFASQAATDTTPKPCSMILDAAQGGYGMYFISDNTKLYMSEHPLEQALESTNERTTFFFPDLPTATVTNEQALDTPTGPTEGCYRYERQDTFLARLAIVQQNGETTARRCEEPAYVILTGSNFGISKPTLASGLRVLFESLETGVVYEASSTSRRGDAGEFCTTCIHQHNKLVVQIPPGAGKNLVIKVEVGLGEYTQMSQSPWPLFHYAAPFILESVPGTVSRSKGFLNGQGESVVLRGYNFGGKPSNVTILLSGKLCPAANWVSGSLDIDGTPFLTCGSSRDILGPKSVFVCVAGQATLNPMYREDSELIKTGQSLGIWAEGIAAPKAISYSAKILSTINTQCRTTSNGTKFYGDMFGLCQECPVGSNCDNLPETRFGPPPASTTFYRFPMLTWDPALQAVPARTQQRCSRETWDQENLGETYPNAVINEFCYDYVRCTPPESCVGENQCALGYQYTLDECQKVHGPGLTLTPNTSFVSIDDFNTVSNSSMCRITLDPYTGEWKGVQSDCNPTGKICKPGNPEYCSQCTVMFKQPDDPEDEPEPFGYCKCTEPERCAFCTIFKFYRLNGECRKCPDNPALLIAMFFVIAAACIAGGYFLQRKNFNLAFISIGVDYFQVLALFASTKVAWPPIIYELFQLLSLINFNIDITAPECLVPTLEYDFKWYLMESIPLMMATLLIILHFGYTGYKFYIQGHRADIYSHVSRLYAVYFTALYYLYINVTKKALDVFNCNPADPDDGYFYATFTSLSCEGSVCRCGESVQASLVPWAILALVLYTFGFPFFIATRLLKYRYEILEDQYLRANGIGESRLTNVNAYDVRKRYSKLYFHFRPERNFWILVILARKFGIVFAGLMFRGNVGFQLAVVLLVLFVSYVLQVTHRPYMSSGEREKVKESLDVFVKKALTNEKYSWYPEIQQNVLEARRRFLKKKRKQLMVRFDEKGEKEDHLEKKQDNEDEEFKDKELKKNATNYFFDYNTVEATLLACAVLVALIGVMFESGRFNSNRPDLRSQQEFLAWAVIIVIFGSIIYYFVVFFGEMWQITGSNKCLRFFMRKKKDDKVTNEDIDDTVILDTNPLHAQLASSPLDIKAKQDEMVDALKKAGEQNDQLRKELDATRRQAALELARFEKLVKQGKAEETEDDHLDDDTDGGQGPQATSWIPRKTITGSRKGRGKGGMSDLLKGKTLDAASALEHDRQMRGNRGTVSRELGHNPKLNDAYKNSVGYAGEDDESINPIFQQEKTIFQDQVPAALDSLRKSVATVTSTIRRKTLGFALPSPKGNRQVTTLPANEEEKSNDA